jgi:hypothetical protein
MLVNAAAVEREHRDDAGDNLSARRHVLLHRSIVGCTPPGLMP